MRFINKWKYKPCVAAIINWKELVHTRVRIRNLMARATTEKSFQWKSKAMNSWKEFNSNFDHKVLQAGVARLEGEVKERNAKIVKLESDMADLVGFRDKVFNRDRDKALRVLNRVCHSQLSMALCVWVDAVTETKRLEGLRERFAVKWKLRPCLSALISWREYVRTRKKLRHILQRACSDYKFKKKSAAINSWKAFNKSFDTDALHSQVMQLSATNRQHNKDNKELKKELEQMQDLVDNLFHDKKRRAMAIMSKIMNHQKYSAFKGWMDNVATLKRQEFIVAKFVKRMVLSGCIKCVIKWREMVHQRKKMRNFVKKFLLSKKDRLKAAAYRTWAHKAKRLNEKDANKEIRKLNEFLGKQKAEVDELTTQVRDSEQLIVKLQQEKIGVLKKNMQKFVNMWQHKSLLSTFTAWSIYTKKNKQEKVFMARFMKKMLNRTLCKYYNSWHEYSLNEKRNRFIMQKFVARMKNQLITKCVESWKNYTIKR